jgi:hypothetical protein
LNRDDLNGWVQACWTYLMLERDGTVEDVAQAFHDHLAAEKWFPRIADLTWRVEALVKKRLDSASTRAAYHEPPPLPVRDWSKVPTHRLPFNYDYTKDPHWQTGIALMSRAVKAKGDLGPMGNMAREMAKKMGMDE